MAELAKDKKHISITKLPKAQKEQPLFDRSFFDVRASVDERIQANKARALTTVRRRAHQAALTGEILPLNV